MASNESALVRLRRVLRPRTRLRALTGRLAPAPAPASRPTGRPVSGSGPKRTPPPPVGEVPVEPTHVGPVFDEAVAEARGRLRPGTGPAYDLVYEHLDPVHYVLQAPRLLESSKVDLVRHFLKNGEKDLLDPEPGFSMFRYLERYPERAGADQNPYVAWLSGGKDTGEVADPAVGHDKMAHVLGLAPDDVVTRMAARRADLLDRWLHGELGRMFAKAAEIEPLIAHAWTQVPRVKLLPMSDQFVVAQVVAMHALQEAAGFRRARLVLVINRPRWGGGRRLEGHLAHALVTRGLSPEDVVVVTTDLTGETPPGRFPDGVREVDFASIVGDMPPEDADHVLVSFLRSLEADAIVNINSSVMYRSMRLHGKALAASERLFLVFFCNEQGPLGQWFGWSLRYFYRAFDYVAGIITDSDSLARTLADTYQLDDEPGGRITPLHAPVDPTIPVAAPAAAVEGRRPQVFWAGRWDRQKRIGLVLEIARRMPDVDFRMWGEAVLGSDGISDLPDNVRLEGRYAHFSDLDLSQADAWLYTSAWDGVPSLLLEVAMTGVPLVGTVVGGTEEVITGAGAWPIGEHEDAASYEIALRKVLADPDAARERALVLREDLARHRTLDAFADEAAGLLLRAGSPHDATEEAAR